MRPNLRVVFLCIAMLFYTCQAKAAYFRGLGDLLGGQYYSNARGVSADGTVVVGESVSAIGTEAYRWTLSGGMVSLRNLTGGGFNSGAQGVSGDGSAMVGSFEPGYTPYEAFRWNSDDGMVSLGFLPNKIYSIAYGVSVDGSVIVGDSWSSNSAEAFRWNSDGSMVSLGVLSGHSYSHAVGVSADGSVVVGDSYSLMEHHAFRWTQSGGMVSLDSESSAYGISADGSVVVGYDMIYKEARLWTSDGGVVNLGVLPGGHLCIARAVSGDGSVVVGEANYDEAFIWDSENGMQSLEDFLIYTYGLDLTGWSLNMATGISADGKTIVGSGYNPDGNQEAWIANISYVPAADFDKDKEVDGFDLCHFILAYSNNIYPDADLNSDGSINSKDFEIIVQEYGWYFEYPESSNYQK